MSGTPSTNPAADLLASLRATSATNSPLTPAAEAVRSPDVGSRIGLPATESSPFQKMSRQGTPGAQAPPDLLSLLKFGKQTSTPPTQTAQPSSTEHQSESQRPSVATPHGRGISTSDLVSSIAGGKLSTPALRERSSTPTASIHQTSLLKLLNQTASGARKSSEPTGSPIGVQTATGGSDKVKNGTPSVPERQQSPIHYFGSKENTPIPFDAEALSKASPLQSTGAQGYFNPFDLRAASHATAKRKSSTPSPSLPEARATFGSITSQSHNKPHDLTVHPHLSKKANTGSAMGNTSSQPTATVPETVSKVGSDVGREVQDKLAEAEKAHAAIKQEADEDEPQVNIEDIQEHVHEAAAVLKVELDKKENKDVLEDVLPTPTAEAVKDIIDEAVAELSGDREVPVYQFPMRPFVSIDLTQQEPPALSIREQSDLPVARFKKDFDQADRALGAATTTFIVYAMPKTTGGVRVIEQESGQSSSVFTDANDRIFNATVATGVGHTEFWDQNVLATGVSGTVYWTTISSRDVQVTEAMMHSSSLRFPPVQAGSDSTSGGQLKTRAKKSNRHPELFAVGRGKSIQIVFPNHALSSEFTRKNVVDTEQYFKSRSLKVTTGKAGKDFAFSEDDTILATLDKAGKLRLWDIQELIDKSNATASRLAPIEIKTPVLTYATSSASEKSWPTSVLFVDKARPYVKGYALRYVIVGLKQNHTLQLWDLCLGKPVQEVNFSHENETDPICSVCYHPGSGIIIVGHPTRNSLYFIHLSAPKYNLSSISQAKFAQKVAQKDGNLPRAEATAIMSGLREYSLADKGQLRSVELTQTVGENTPTEGDDEPPLFELVVVHSKGVLCLGVKKGDLGWSSESKVLHPVDAEKAGTIVVKELKEPSATQLSEPSTNSETLSSSPAKGVSPKPSKENVKAERAEASAVARDADKKKEKKKGNQDSPAKPSAASEAAETYANAAQKGANSKPDVKTPQKNETIRPSLPKNVSREAPETLSAPAADDKALAVVKPESAPIDLPHGTFEKEINKIQQGISGEFNKVLSQELDRLYKQVAEDKRVQDAAGAAKQDAILRLVASVLDDNVEKSLTRIIHKSIHDEVVPAIGNTTAVALNNSLPSLVGANFQSVILPVVKQSVNESVTRSLQSPEMVKSVSDQVSKSLSGHIERELTTVLNKTITPTFQNLALSISQKVGGETERRVHDQLQHFTALHRQDTAKIDQLNTLVTRLSDMVQTMANAQTQFQDEILKLQQSLAANGAGARHHHHSPTPSESASARVAPEQEEVDKVAALLNEGDTEGALIAWVQSGKQDFVFDELLYRFEPGFLAHVAPLIVLSCGATITNLLESRTAARLTWLEVILKYIVPTDPETRQVGGKILDVIIGRLEGEYMRTSGANGQDPLLRSIVGAVLQAKEVRRGFGA